MPVQGSGASTRVYAIESTPGYNAEPGAVQPTGRNLDVAMKGNAWLAVQGLDGTEAYTRAGALDVNAEGLLVTQDRAAPCWATAGRSTCRPNAQLQIGADGTVSAGVGNAKPQAVGRLKLVTPEAPLNRGTDGLFRAADGDLPADATAKLQDGALEGSNVSPIETMIAMIAAARQFEQQMKMMHSAQEKEQAAAKLLGSG